MVNTLNESQISEGVQTTTNEETVMNNTTDDTTNASITNNTELPSSSESDASDESRASEETEINATITGMDNIPDTITNTTLKPTPVLTESLIPSPTTLTGTDFEPWKVEEDSSECGGNIKKEAQVARKVVYICIEPREESDEGEALFLDGTSLTSILDVKSKNCDDQTESYEVKIKVCREIVSLIDMCVDDENYVDDFDGTNKIKYYTNTEVAGDNIDALTIGDSC